jgi:NTP pyrophosphatase (non-canonical NTP hydrolase)
MSYPIYVDNSKIHDEINNEVMRATRKFPTWPTDPVHASDIIAEELGELKQAILEVTYEPGKSTESDVRKETIQTAAMCIRFLKSIDKYKYEPSEQHEQ